MDRLRVGRDRLEVELAEDVAREQILRLVSVMSVRVEFAGPGSRTIRVKSPADPLALATNLLQHLNPSGSVPRLPLSAAGS